MAAPKTLPLPTDGYGSLSWWSDAIKAGEEIRDSKSDLIWKPNVRAYTGESKKPNDDAIPVNVDFYNTEQKKAQLFFRTPEVQLTSKMPGLEDAVQVFQPVLNHKLGPHGVNAAVMMDECLADGVCASGVWASKIGYEATVDGMVQVQMGERPDPAFVPPTPQETQPGTVLGLNQPTPQAPMVPVMVPAPKIIHERYFWERVSPGKVGWPADFHGSDYDKAAFLWFEFTEDLQVAKNRGWVDKDFSGSSEEKHRLTTDPKTENRGSIVIGKEVWYRAARFDPTVKHPEAMRRLVLIDGKKEPVVHEDSPYQKFDPTTGKLVAGMRGFPVHVGALRYVSDSAFPPSDCTISRAQVDELAEARAQMRLQRKRAIPMRWFNRNLVGPEDIDRLKRGEVQGLIPLDGNGNEILGEVARAEYPRENFQILNTISSDIDKEWALGSNGGVLVADEQRSATEVADVAHNINTRMDYERTKVLAWFVRGAEKLGSLVQMFADQEDYIEIVGPDGERRLEAWDKTRIQGEFAYSAKPDSAQKIDAATDFKRAMDSVNFMAKSSYTNQLEMARWFWSKAGQDPAKMVQQPQPPGPPPPNVSVRITMDDVVGPASAVAMELLQQAGYKISPQAIAATAAGQARVEAAQQQEQEAQTAHGGPSDKADVLSKHASDLTGQLHGSGKVAAA
jgi:hypothetical protein